MSDRADEGNGTPVRAVIEREDIAKRAREAGEMIAKSAKALKERYELCDAQGHHKLNTENNYCNFCYRRTIYETPETDRIREEREKLPSWERPLDAPAMMRRAQEETDVQRMDDYWTGIGTISGELKKQ